MNTPLKVVFLLLIVYTIIDASEVIHEINNVIQDVQKLYLSPSVVIVYNQRNYGFDREKILIEAIKMKSRQFSLSQVIDYDNLPRTSKSEDNILRALVIHNEEGLRYAIEVTKNVDMSLHPWLLLSMNNSDFDCDNPGNNFFKLRMDTRMAAKCDGNEILKKYYAILDNQTEVVDLTEKTPWNQFKIKDSKSFIEVETDMRGLTLKLAKRRNADDEVNENNSKFVIAVVDELAGMGHFKTKISHREDKMGHFNRQTNAYTGLMKIMIEGEADIGIVFFSLSNSRMNVVDFATPLALARFYLYAKLPDSTRIRWDAYFLIFDEYTWLTIGLSIFAFAIMLCLINLQSMSIATFSQQFINVWGIFSQQGLAENPLTTPSRILSLSILFASLIIHAIYSASITSYITQLTTDLPFSTYEEFMRDTNYKITVLTESRDEDLFLEDDDKQLSPLRPRLRNYCHRAHNPYDGFVQACEPNTVFYSDEVSFDGIKSPPCKLGSANMKRREHMSFILTKNSPYTKTISYFLFRLREHGIIKRLKNKYFYKFTEIPDNQPNVISLEEIVPILAILFAGVILAMIVWFFELALYSFGVAVNL